MSESFFAWANLPMALIKRNAASVASADGNGSTVSAITMPSLWNGTSLSAVTIPVDDPVEYTIEPMGRDPASGKTLYAIYRHGWWGAYQGRQVTDRSELADECRRLNGK